VTQRRAYPGFRRIYLEMPVPAEGAVETEMCYDLAQWLSQFTVRAAHSQCPNGCFFPFSLR
jgi:hypothetical protein